MIGGEPQLATPIPGKRPNPGDWRALLPRLGPTTLLFGAAALYCLVAMAWSVAGREDLGNARAASLTAVIALAIALVTIIARIGDRSDGVEFYGWLALAAGIALLASTEIARFSVLWTERITIWQPDSIGWLQAAGALCTLSGTLLIIGGVTEDLAVVAAALGVTVCGIALTAPFVIGAHLALDGDLAAWTTVAPLLGLAFATVAAIVSLRAWHEHADENDLVTAGLTLLAMFLAISIALQSLGKWDDAPGVLALARWVLPVSALGAISAAAFQAPGSASNATWQEWNAASGHWPLVAAGALVLAAVVALVSGSELGHDLAAAASLSALLVFVRQGISLRVERKRVATLAELTEELLRLANVDMLTGLPNRAALTNRLAEEFERAFRYEQPMSVLFIDIDHFKRVNDTLGHAAGDDVLRQVAESLRYTARSIDFVGRYGGEEFLIIAPGTWTADAQILAERLREHVGRVTVPTDQPGSRRTTISIGIAGYPEHAEDVASMVERADQALYQAKSAGRDRVALYSSGDDPS